MKQAKVKALNKKLAKIKPEINLPEEIPDYSMDAEMRYGLAQAYALPGFRKYLQTRLNIMITWTALSSEDETDLVRGKAKALLLGDLLSKMKSAYTLLGEINSLKKKPSVS